MAMETKKLKVLLVNLPWQKGERWGVRAGSRWPHIKDKSEGRYLPFPFFLAYSAALLKKHDIEAEVIDAVAEEISADKFMDRLRRREFDIFVAETSVPSFDYDMKLLREISSLGVPIVLCGPQPRMYEEGFLDGHKFVKFVLYGEYEWTLLELMQALSQGERDFSAISGLIWKNSNGKTVKNARRQPFPIDTLPWPERAALPMEKYWDLPGGIPQPSVQMVASRGCTFGCNFCLWPQVLFGGRTYRARDVQDVVNEMEYLIREKGYKSVYFDDDTFNIGKPRMSAFCAELIKRDLHKIPWAIMAKADLMDEEILDKMKQAGLYAVKYGVESAAQELVDRCGKNLQLAKAEEMIEYTKSLGIKVHLTFSFGLPGETRKTARRTVDYAVKLDPHSVQFSIITPFPGTALFEQLDKEGKITTKDFSLYDGHYNCVFQPDNLAPEDLERAKQYAYRRWARHQNKQRGIKGNLHRFFYCWRHSGPAAALKKTAKYSIEHIRYIGSRV
ncbi:MAG: radical SAM protein [Candidatus Omnitrophota bacterium]